MVDIWYTSDLHFFHKKVCAVNKRPWHDDENTERLIDLWNSQVRPGDIVCSMGDFAFLKASQYQTLIDLIEFLNGNKIFIKGNHDESKLWEKVRVAQLSRVLYIGDYKKIVARKQEIVLSHYPFEIWNRSHYGAWHLHGHSHGSMPVRGKRLDVGIDNHPQHRFFTFDEVAAHMEKQEIWAPDNHKVKV